MANSEEITRINQEDNKDLQDRITKITRKVEAAMKAVSDIMALMAAGQQLYQNANAQVQKIQRDVKDLEQMANNAVSGAKNTIGGAAKNMSGQSLYSAVNPVTISRATGAVDSIANSAFSLLDSGMSSLDFAMSSADYIPSKVQEKISQKELQRKLQEAQKKLENIKKSAEEWIKENTKKYTDKITERQKDLQDQLNRQVQRALNSVAAFTGADPAMLNDIIERAEKVGLNYALGKKSAADELDDFIGFAKSSALNTAINAATAKGMESLDKAGFKDLADDIRKDVPAIKKITGLALEKAGIANNLGGNITSNIKDRLNINL